MNIERAIIYAGGAFAIAMSVWVFIAFLRAEEILDLKVGLFCAGFLAVDALRRGRETRGRSI